MAEGEIGIEDILGEIRTVMLSIPCPYCGKIPNKPIKPGMEVQCSACGHFYTVEKTLNETTKNAIKKIIDQVLQKYDRKLEDFGENMANTFISYADQTIREIRRFYEKSRQLPTKSDVEELLLNSTNMIMNTIASYIEALQKQLGEEHAGIKLEIKRIGEQVISIKGLLKPIIDLVKGLPGPLLPSLTPPREIRLTYEDDRGQIREFSLPKGEIIIGRDPHGFEIQARTPKEILNLGIFDATIGRKHMKIFFNGKNVCIEDLKSKNGTYINGEKLEPYKKYIVKDGDEILLGALGSKLKVKFLY
ncbi:MAG: hypothetical protein B6U95_08185 [Thermofilum sp. ex4484_82]|nr:MAG: hypothetical protein B6U95_08185 [Thermofilum sp. ex4484_82]OYT36596.1 MAG: hypothetical protein B6U96_08185 [Archaeoglobales archaeon ex4484_92]